MDIPRIKFLPGQQKDFIEAVYTKSNLSTKQLADIAGIHPRSFCDWRRETITVSLPVALLFSEKFNVSLPENPKVLVERWRSSQQKANRIGGIYCYKKYGSFATQEGRSKGGRTSIRILQEKGIFPRSKEYSYPNYSVELADFVGIMLGDGGITPSFCSITLNSEADAEYILYVQSFAEKLFGEPPKAFFRTGQRTCILYYNGVNLIRYFKSIGLKVGNKVKQQVAVPKWISSNTEYKKACLRGLMDTDGGVFLHKYKVKNQRYLYKKICFANRSVPLLNFVEQTLRELGFTPKIVDKVANKKVWLYNEREVEQYLRTVGTHNARLLKYNGELPEW